MTRLDHHAYSSRRLPRKKDPDPPISTITDVDAPQPKGGASREACVVIIYGTDLGRRMTLGRSTFTLGRSSKSDLSLDQESVSRHHAKLIWSGHHYAVIDQRSKNGTYVNDE